MELNSDISDNELMTRFEYMRIKKGITKTECAEALKISRGTLYRRLENPSKLTLRELLNLRDLFEVNKIEDVFNLDDLQNEEVINEILEKEVEKLKEYMVEMGIVYLREKDEKNIEKERVEA